MAGPQQPRNVAIMGVLLEPGQINDMFLNRIRYRYLVLEGKAFSLLKYDNAGKTGQQFSTAWNTGTKVPTYQTKKSFKTFFY